MPHRYYAHARPRRQFITTSRLHLFVGDFHIPKPAVTDIGLLLVYGHRRGRRLSWPRAADTGGTGGKWDVKEWIRVRKGWTPQSLQHGYASAVAS